MYLKLTKNIENVTLSPLLVSILHKECGIGSKSASAVSNDTDVENNPSDYRLIDYSSILEVENSQFLKVALVDSNGNRKYKPSVEEVDELCKILEGYYDSTLTDEEIQVIIDSSNVDGV